MVSLTGKRKIMVIALVLALVFPAFIALGVVPYLKGVAEDAQDLSKKRRELSLLEDEVRNQGEFSQYSLERTLDFERLASLFVDPGNPTHFLKALEDLSSQSGLALTGIGAGNPQKAQGDTWPSIELKFSSAGSFPALMAFLRGLENLPYLVEIEMLTVSQELTGLKFSITLKLYTR